MMNKQNKLRKILNLLSPDDTSEAFKAFDAEANKLKEALKENIQAKTLEGVNLKLNRFRKAIDLTPLTEQVGKIEEEFNSKIEAVSNLLNESNVNLKGLVDENKQTNTKNIAQNITGVTANITKLENTLSELTKKRDAEVAGMKSALEDLKTLEGKFNSKIENLSKIIEAGKTDNSKSKKELQDEIKKFNKEIDELRTEFNGRISSLGGGSMNRQILVNGVDSLKKYTDINLKDGSNITLTATSDDTNKRVNITINSSGAGSGDVVGPASAVDSNFAAFDTTTGKLIKDSGSKASDFLTSLAGALLLDQTSPQTIINGAPYISAINGGSAANDDITIQGTTNATRTTSYVILQPNGGNVGIGTTSPQSLLSVVGASAKLTVSATTGNPELQFQDGGADEFSIYYDTGSDYLAFVEDGIGSRMVINNGNVGIGTTTPGAKLDVYKSSGWVSSAVDSGGQFVGMAADSSFNPSIFWSNANGLRFATVSGKDASGWSEKMRISSNGGLSLGSTYVATDPGAGSMIVSGNVGIGTTGPKSTLHVSGSFGHKVVTKAFADTGYTAASETVILCNAVDGAITINLPVATNSTDRIYYIKKIDASANAITIEGNASETIDGELTQIISNQYTCMQIVCDGSNWYII